MSALGLKQTFDRSNSDVRFTPPEADIRPRDQDVCFGPQADSCTAAILPHVVGVAQRGQGRVPLRFSGGISIDKNFKIDAAQQLHTVVCFNFSLFHLCHTLVNSSSRSRDQIEQIL
jgi:hypothetical protein